MGHSNYGVWSGAWGLYRGWGSVLSFLALEEEREEGRGYVRIECTFTLAPNVSLHAHLFWIGTANKQSLRVNCHKDN